jgi:hypothetical protein
MDDQNTIQNPSLAENPIPPSSQEPVVDMPIPTPEATPETGTAQILPNEPFSPEPVPVIVSPKSLLAKAIDAIRFRKRAKLDKIMKLAVQRGSITNDDVQKLVRVSDATASRYLAELTRQSKLKQIKAGVSTRYEPLIGSNGGN